MNAWAPLLAQPFSIPQNIIKSSLKTSTGDLQKQVARFDFMN